MTATKQQLADAIESGITNASSNGTPTWLGATDSLIDLLVAERECFSSGEIAAHLRTFRPDLRFSVTSNVGEHVRDRFYADTMPLYPNPDGTFTPVEKVPRTTGGFSRTPPGTEVFVYAPNWTAGQAHEFEVEIPKPGTQVPLDPDGLPPRPAQAANPLPASHFVNLTARPTPKNLTATVHNDGRLCIPRSALEALLHATQTALKGGDSVFVIVDDTNGEARVGLDRENGAQGYQLSAGRGRVLFPHPAHPFTVGDTFAVRIDGPGRRLVIDLG